MTAAERPSDDVLFAAVVQLTNPDLPVSGEVTDAELDAARDSLARFGRRQLTVPLALHELPDDVHFRINDAASDLDWLVHCVTKVPPSEFATARFGLAEAMHDVVDLLCDVLEAHRAARTERLDAAMTAKWGES